MRSGRRTLTAACAGLVVAAAALWASSTLTWYRFEVPVPLRGEVTVELDGAAVLPALTGVALLALAAVAAAVAVSGVLRRLLGVAVAVAGGGVATAALARVLVPTVEAGGPLPPLPPGVSEAALRDGVAEVTAAPVLAVAGAVLLAAAGVVVLVREPALPRFGARYAAAGARTTPADPDRAAWEALDSGRDPTAGGRDGPGASPPTGPV